MKNKYICNCSRCGREYIVECTEYNYLNGKYRKTCSSFCANSHPMTEDKKNKIRLGVLKYLENQEKPLYVYVCDKCGKEFSTSKKRRSDRNIHCEECIQKRKHFNENPETIMELSKRTISKILNRSRKGCSICGWNESICDIHHIVERCKGGSDDIDNLIIVCPNCHRVIHSNKKYDVEFLKSKSILKTFSNWKDFYYPSN